MSQMVFPASLYALGIKVNSIVPIVGEQSAAFLLNGYSQTEKDIKKYYKTTSSEFRIYNDSFFKKHIVRKTAENWEVIDFHCTPIFSIAIIPKNSGLSCFDSKRILYQYNIQESTKRLAAIIEALDSIDSTNHDLICEKVNTARRVLELS